MKDKNRIIEQLRIKGTPEAEALAYLIYEIIPEDRTSKKVFRSGDKR